MIDVLIALLRDTNMASTYEVLLIWTKQFTEYNTYEKLHRDLNLGEVVYISIIYHISNSLLLNFYDDYFGAQISVAIR